MISIKEDSLQKALQKVGLGELPKALKSLDMKDVLSAIVLTKRINGQEAYAYAENDGNGGVHIREDFGPCVRIHSIISIHPIKVIDRKVVPDLRSDKQIIQYLVSAHYDRDEIVALLSKDGKTPEQIRIDRDKLKQYVNSVAIGFAKRMAAEEERVKNIGNISSRIEK